MRRMIELCAAAHPYYQRVFRDMDLAPADFGRVEDLRKLPVLRKEEYARDPEMFRLRLDGVPGPVGRGDYTRRHHLHDGIFGRPGAVL
jgi:hypothetical protein